MISLAQAGRVSQNSAAQPRVDLFAGRPARMKVEIYDQVYNVAGDLEPAYVEQLAKYVDLRMRQVARGTGAVDSVKVAVLAALSIADELHALRQSRENNDKALRAGAERCLKMIDRALQQSS